MNYKLGSRHSILIHICAELAHLSVIQPCIVPCANANDTPFFWASHFHNYFNGAFPPRIVPVVFFFANCLLGFYAPPPSTTFVMVRVGTLQTDTQVSGM